MAADTCTEAPTTSCLIALAFADMNAITEEKHERWQGLYDDLLIDEVLRIFDTGDIEAVWLALDKIKSSNARTDAVTRIAYRMSQSGDERILEFIWEMDRDDSRLDLMLRVIDELLKKGHKRLAEKVYDDAQFVFRRLSAAELTDRIYDRMISLAKKFDDSLLLSTLANDYQQRMAGKTGINVLMRSGAYEQARQLANETLSDKELPFRMEMIAASWLGKRGEQALLSSVESSGDELFRASAMLALGKHARRELNDPLQAQGYLLKAERYVDGIASSVVRDELYDDIARQYLKLATKEKLEVDRVILAMAKKVGDPEKSVTLQLEVIAIHVGARDYAQAERIVERENSPVLSAIYYYLLAETARESGDTSAAISAIHQAQDFMLQNDSQDLSFELSYEMGTFLHKLEDDSGAIKAFQEAAQLARALPFKKRLEALKKCEEKLLALGAEQEAQAVMASLVREIRSSGDDAATIKVVLGFLPRLSNKDVSPQITQKLYELESQLQGDALVDFYMQRAKSSHDEGDNPATLRFLNMALQQARSDKRIDSCLQQGLEFFEAKELFPLRLSLLQHPSIPYDQQQTIVQRLFEQYLEDEHLAWAETVAELMSEDEQFMALIALLSNATANHKAALARRLYAQIMQRVAEKPHLKTPLLDEMIGNYEQALAVHYRDDIEKMVAALDDRGERLYFRALQLQVLRQPAAEKLDVIRKMMPELTTLSTVAERGRRAMIYLLFASALNPSF